jgi:hypothetical protein
MSAVEATDAYAGEPVTRAQAAATDPPDLAGGIPGAFGAVGDIARVCRFGFTPASRQRNR